METRKSKSAFPIVANVRKGSKKQPKQPGRDLEQYFRIDFPAGMDKFKQRFMEVYKDDITIKDGEILVKCLHCMIPSGSVWNSATFFNEAHSSGRMIAKADDTHFISLRTGHAGKDYAIKDGQPHRAYDPSVGELIDYEQADGKKVKLKLKSQTRLNLFLPDMMSAVNFQLKSTAVYDKFRVEDQLEAVQMFADALNGGNASGVPILVYRSLGDVVWNKPDGSATRLQKWLITIEIDPKAFEQMIRRMSANAISGGTQAALLPGPKSQQELVSIVATTIEEDDDDDDTIIEGHATEPAETKPEKFAILCRLLFASLAVERSAKILSMSKTPEAAMKWVDERKKLIEQSADGLAAHVSSNWPNFGAFIDGILQKNEKPDPFAIINGIDVLAQLQRDEPAAFASMNDDQIIAFILDYQR